MTVFRSSISSHHSVFVGFFPRIEGGLLHPRHGRAWNHPRAIGESGLFHLKDGGQMLRNLWGRSWDKAEV